MPGGAAAEDDHALGIHHAFFVLLHAAEAHPAFFGIHAAAHTFGDGGGLLENFLEHEVLVAAFFQLLDFQFDLLRAGGHFFVAKGFDRQIAAAGHGGDFLVVEVHHFFGVFHDGRGVGGDQEFFFANADDERAGLARGHQFVRLVAVHDHNGVGALYLSESLPHGFF